MFFGLLFAQSSQVQAHAAHSSMMEAEAKFDSAGLFLEVSWDVERQDVELALAIESNEHVSFDAGDSFHGLLIPWIQKNVRVSTATASSTSPTSLPANAEMHFVGKELGATRMVLFFTLRPHPALLSAVTRDADSTGPARISIQVPALLSVDDTVHHWVNLRMCGALHSLSFDRAHAAPQTLPLSCETQRPNTSTPPAE